jgi:hypothetical protein
MSQLNRMSPMFHYYRLNLMNQLSPMFHYYL